MQSRIIEDIKFPITRFDERLKKRVPIKEAWENTDYILKRLDIHPKLNILTKEIEIQGHGFKDMSVDSAIIEIRGVLAMNGLKLTKSDTRDNISRIAENNQYSPVRDYLKKCREAWDGQDHIDELFKLLDLDPDVKQEPDFCKKLITKWLLSCVRMAFNNGEEAAQGVLILVGGQGIGKTRFLYTILPRPEWGTDGVSLNPSVKDDVLKVMRFWIVELGELGETIKREKLDSLKQYFTQPKDVLRRPYTAGTMSFPRTTVFYGSVNGNGFLKDNTGDRRYWPISVLKVHNEANIDINQVWGQLTYLAMEENEPTWLDDEERAKLEEMNQQYKFISSEETALLDKLDWDAPIERWREATATELCEELHINRSYNRRMGKALQAIAMKDDRVKIPKNHMNGRRYFVPRLLGEPLTYGDMWREQDKKDMKGHEEKS